MMMFWGVPWWAWLIWATCLIIAPPTAHTIGKRIGRRHR